MSAERTMIASGREMSDETSYRSRGKRRSPATAMLFNVRILYIVLWIVIPGARLVH
jgi:hypothetical protein